MGTNDLQPRAQRSIRWLVTVLVVAVAGPVAFAGIVLGYAYQVQSRKSAEETLLAHANAASAGVAQFLTYSERVLERVAKNAQIQKLDASSCAIAFPALNDVLSPTFVSVDLWNDEGEVVCSTLPGDTPRLNLRGTRSFDEAIRIGAFRVSPMFKEARTQRWSTALTVPVIGANGRRGIVSALVDLERFREILASLSLPDSAIVTLAEASGTVVARSKSAGTSVGTQLPLPKEGALSNDVVFVKSVSEAPSQEGKPFVWARVQVPRSRWVLYAGMPNHEVYGAAASRSAQVTVAGILVLLIGGISGRLIYRRLTTPLEELVDGLANARPDVARPLPSGGPDEIALVAERFNNAWSDLLDANREKEQSSERVRSLVENAVMGICVVTDDGQFVEVNQTLVDLLGFDSRAALLEASLSTVQESTTSAGGLQELSGGAPVFRAIPTRWRKRNGEPIELRISGRRLTLLNEQPAFELIVEDVSEVSRLQMRVAQTQKMEALGRLAGGVAHDFNNLLTIVLGQADLLLEDSSLSSEHQEQVREIYDASTRGAGLNRQLLAFGRGRATTIRAMDLNTLLRNAERILRRAAGESVHLEMQADGPLVIQANHSQVEQVLLNLVVNARDAMAGGGRLTLRTWEQEVSADDAAQHTNATAGAHVVLEVSDTGAGIPDDVLPFIFEPFYSTKTELSGTGLGLATVYGVVTAAGGHVRVETVQGLGTRFRVYWPRYSGAVEGSRTLPDSRAPLERAGRILLVEDEAGVRRLLEQVLRKAGYRVTAAVDGLEAIQLATRADEPPFDLLITDVVMPGLGGHEVATRLAEAKVVNRALLISGYPEGLPDDGPAGLTAWSFLAKPCTSSELLNEVRRMLEMS